MRNNKATRRKLYFQFRKGGWLAHAALEHARTTIAWDKANGQTVYSEDNPPCYTPRFRDVRIRIAPDDDADLDNLLGDCFDHKANPDISPSKLDSQRQHEIDRINRDGVYGVIGEYYNGEEWEHADSCWGFIGDDWKQSGYDLGIMRHTLQAASIAERCRNCHRPRKARR